jgi:serine/threonine protein kinase
MKFGQYELLEQIAVGGMSEVFKGRVVAAEGFEKLVAIKRILPDLAEDERFVKMLLTEARIHSALSHRNIVQIHDLGISEDGEYFIVLEYVEGYDLRVIMEQINGAGEIIPEALSLHIAAEIAQGLNFAHELRGPDGQALGLIHRDVTPSNVLISFAGEVKLSDFGLAKRRHDRSVVGSLKGNLAYMSPEQANQAQLDRRTDIFSLGAILFELLTGKRLREITDEVAGWSQVASGVVPSARQVRPDLPAAVEALLDRALAADPAARFPDAASFGAAIRNVLGDLSVAVGASDLAALLSVVTRPRQARTLMMERSKVIRLGPEAEALKEAFAAPATPAPVPTVRKTVHLADPGPTPPPNRNFTPARTPARSPTPPRTPARSVTPGRTPVVSSTPARTPPLSPTPVEDAARSLTPGRTPVRSPTPARTPARSPTPPRNAATRPAGNRPALPAAGAPDPNATPPPHTPLPPARARGYTPQRPSDPELTPRATPAQSLAVDPRAATLYARGPAPGRPQATGRSGPTPAGSHMTMRGPAPANPRHPSQPAPVASAPQPAQVRTRLSAPLEPVAPGTPAYGVQRPPQEDFARAPTLPPPGDHLGFPEARRGHHETARVQFRPQRQWGGMFTVVVLLLAAAGVGVHLWVIPLDVLITWREPTGLSIRTDPPGASVRVDGVAMPSSAPATVSVWRDRKEHVIEASRPGYETTRLSVRYDKAASLSFTLPMKPDPKAVPAAAPSD